MSAASSLHVQRSYHLDFLESFHSSLKGLYLFRLLLAKGKSKGVYLYGMPMWGGVKWRKSLEFRFRCRVFINIIYVCSLNLLCFGFFLY
jgi:hypothetical protein